MGVVTVFLWVLILALVIGNILLFFFRASTKGGSAAKASLDLDEVPPGNFPEQVSGSFNEPGRLLSAERKLELAHRRLQELETKKPDFSKAEAEVLKRKLEKLDNFKSTAEAEIIALKEIIVELKEKKDGHKSKAKIKDISDKELKKLVFRSASA